MSGATHRSEAPAGPAHQGSFPGASRHAAFDAADALIAATLLACRKRLGRPVLVGLCGAQGSGKSTTAERLRKRLDRRGAATVVLSIDDFYRTRAEREALARDVHPLLATRGVPGTHDIALAQEVICGLLASNGEVRIPLFDKTRDDRLPPEAWRVIDTRPAVIILEGWCVGAAPSPASALARPVNELERLEDADGTWRRHINTALAGPYAALFGSLDYRVLLRAPGFANVHAWRLEQEENLHRVPGHAMPAMDSRAIERFIAHYERLTRWIMDDEPADLVIRLAADRQPLGWRRRQPPADR